MEVRKNTRGITMDSPTTTITDNAEFCLPTHFLTDDDFLAGVDHRILKKEPKNFDLFSGGFDPFGALDSPVSSSETDKDHENDEHELLAELTRQLARSSLHETRYNANPTHAPAEKPWAFSTSPQSTLTEFGPWSNRSGFSSNGSPSQVPSPPLTPPGAKNDAAWELLYEAAGQVARLKMNAMAAQLNQNYHHHHQQNRGLLRNSSLSMKSAHINSFYDFPATNQYQQQLKWQGREEWYCQHHHQSRACGSGGGALGLPPSAWPPLRAGVQQPHQPHHQHHHHNNTHTHRQQTGGSGMRAVFLGGPGSGPGAVPPVKRQSTGTGVFLPRRIGSQPEPRKKPSGCSTVLLPARVVQALNLDLEEINYGVNHNSQARFGSGFVTDHDVLIARRNALLNQQRRTIKPEGAAAPMVGSHDIRLPSDWTY